MIVVGYYSGLLFAAVSLLLTTAYIFIYSSNIRQAFEGRVPDYLKANLNDLVCVLLARTALDKTLLQSCGIVAGIAFGFVGLSLFLLGIKGDSDAAGQMGEYSFTLRRLAPGSLVMLASLSLIGVCANHRVELDLKTTPGNTNDALWQSQQPQTVGNPTPESGSVSSSQLWSK